MRQKLIYDLPTRLFHWLFALCFLTAFVIAKTVEDDSYFYNFHSLAGLTLGFLVILRFVWGFVGTKYAKFNSFVLNPLELVSYLKSVIFKQKKIWAGHNPASSWASLIMMALAMGLAITGYLMTSGGNKEDFEDVHELLANSFIVVVVLHIAGVIIHSIQHKDFIGLSMINGNKNKTSEDQWISSSKSRVALLFLGLVAVFTFQLFKNYDDKNQTLKFFGKTLQLTEIDTEGQQSIPEANGVDE